MLFFVPQRMCCLPQFRIQFQATVQWQLYSNKDNLQVLVFCIQCRLTSDGRLQGLVLKSQGAAPEKYVCSQLLTRFCNPWSLRHPNGPEVMQGKKKKKKHVAQSLYCFCSIRCWVSFPRPNKHPHTYTLC